jgi:hypothetical protein
MLIETLFILIWGSLLFITGFWASKVKLPEEFRGKYRKELFWHRLIPFLYNPQEKIAANDRPLFQEYKRRHALYRTVIFLPLFCFYIYLYFKYVHSE